MEHFDEYVWHLFLKYHDRLDSFDRDCLMHGYGTSCLEGIAAVGEMRKLAELWHQDFELGLVD